MKNDNPDNPFLWAKYPRPSVFMQDPYFRAKADGKTDSQRATDTVEARRTQGVDPGKLYGLGALTAEKEKRLLAYKQFGVYSKAQPSIKQPNKHEK